MTYANPVQAAIDAILDLDIPDDLLEQALAAQLETMLGEIRDVELQ